VYSHTSCPTQFFLRVSTTNTYVKFSFDLRINPRTDPKLVGELQVHVIDEKSMEVIYTTLIVIYEGQSNETKTY
jgi:hypothetical protein